MGYNIIDAILQTLSGGGVAQGNAPGAPPVTPNGLPLGVTDQGQVPINAPINAAGMPGAPGTPSGPAAAPPGPSTLQNIISAVKNSPIPGQVGDAVMNTVAPMVPGGMAVNMVRNAGGMIGREVPPAAAAPPGPAQFSGATGTPPMDVPNPSLPGTTLGMPNGPSQENLSKLRAALDKAALMKNQGQPPGAVAPAAPAPAPAQSAPSSITSPLVSGSDVREILQNIAAGAGKAVQGGGGGAAFLRGAGNTAELQRANESAEAKAKSDAAKTSFDQDMKTQANTRANNKEERETAAARVKNAKVVTDIMAKLSPTMTQDSKIRARTALTNYANSLAQRGISGDKARDMINEQAKALTGDDTFVERGPDKSAAPGAPGKAAPNSAPSYTEGEIRQNPKTGEKIQLKNGQWVPIQ